MPRTRRSATNRLQFRKRQTLKKLFFSSCLHKVQRPAGTSVLWEHACSTWQARPRQVPRCLLRGAMTKAEIQRCYLRSQLHPGSEVPFKGDVLESEHTPLHLLLGFKSSSGKGEVESGGIRICIDVVDPCPPIYLYRANPEGCL